MLILLPELSYRAGKVRAKRALRQENRELQHQAAITRLCGREAKQMFRDLEYDKISLRVSTEP